MSDPPAEGNNGPARGLTFAVVAPAIGVIVFLAILGLSTCVDDPPSGRSSIGVTPTSADPNDP